ncbi:MAG: 3,4-dihydroxy-2-butanone-4-phosphate synthase, partial [Alphaproteobacteria bacterium]
RLQKSQETGAPNPLLKDYGIGAQILVDLGVKNMTLLTGAPKNIVGLEGYGLCLAGYRSLKD